MDTIISTSQDYMKHLYTFSHICTSRTNNCLSEFWDISIQPYLLLLRYIIGTIHHAKLEIYDEVDSYTVPSYIDESLVIDIVETATKLIKADMRTYLPCTNKDEYTKQFRKRSKSTNTNTIDERKMFPIHCGTSHRTGLYLGVTRLINICELVKKDTTIQKKSI